MVEYNKNWSLESGNDTIARDCGIMRTRIYSVKKLVCEMKPNSSKAGNTRNRTLAPRFQSARTENVIRCHVFVKKNHPKSILKGHWTSDNQNYNMAATLPDRRHSA